MNIAVIGTGNVGSSFARQAISVGNSVILANTRGPESLKTLIDELGPDARAATVEDAVRGADLIFLAIPVNRYSDLPAAAFEGKTVIDAGNYYPAWNGLIPELENESTTTAELLQAALPGSTVVKAFNNLGAASITEDASPTGTPDRRALTVASDSPDASKVVAGLIDQMGFDVVDAGPLAEGWRYQRDTPAYGTRHNTQQMTAALGAARRLGGVTQ